MNATFASAPVFRDENQVRGLPVVEREDINLHSPRKGILRVEITFRNPGPDRTRATFGILRSAPLGAFVPWNDLGYFQVPALEPGESIVVGSEYAYDTPQPLGSIDKLPPERVLTALGSEEPGRRRRRQSRPSGIPAPATDLLAMLAMGGAYWAGNLNVFFPGADVERHRALALRIYPGRVNFAAFIVGNLGDRYEFDLAGNAVEWKARLHDSPIGLPILAGSATKELALNAWVRPLSGLVMLAIEPPMSAETGAVNVHIRQESTGREAVVEFTLDSTAAGPGCYKL
jgi:hypothetical protein